MNVESFAAFFVLLALMSFLLQWQVLLATPIAIKGKQGHSHSRKKGFMKWFVDPCSNGFIRPVFQPQNF